MFAMAGQTAESNGQNFSEETFMGSLRDDIVAKLIIICLFKLDSLL